MTPLISACSSHFRPARRMRSPFSSESREVASQVQVFSDKSQLKDTVVRVLYRVLPLSSGIGDALKSAVYALFRCWALCLQKNR